MATYLELKKQAELLMEQVEVSRKTEVDAFIKEVKDKMQMYGLTANEMGFVATRPVASPVQRNRNALKAEAKYRSPTGETWSGGRGRKPDWVMRALKEGQNLEEFLI